MKRNLLLNFAVIFCKITRAVLLLMFLAWTVFFIHLQVDKDFYKNKEVNFNNLGFTYSCISKWKVDKKSDDSNVYIMNEIKTKSVYILYLQYRVALILIFMSFKAFQSVLTSVKDVRVFEKKNVLSFRRIGKYVFIYFLLTSYRIVSFEFGGVKAMTISLTPLIVIVLAFIMAEIFKEGVLLKQENDLTI